MLTNTTTLSLKVNELGQKLMQVLATRASRKLFFNALCRLLHEHFHYDRLCINLYDQQGEMLTYFTAAEGTVVSTLSPVRPAEASSTVAGHVIATRKPVIITDFAQYFSESSIHPIAEAGLTATMAFPLILDNEIIATLHCSFAEKPDNLYGITSFLLNLCPFIATCLGAILSLEQSKLGEFSPPLRPVPPAVMDDAIIRHSPVMREVMRKVEVVAKLHVPVLLLGETGTGKSLIAHDIHRRSARKDARFVKVNCPALPQSLFESELFGHAKGAFTGAANKRVGRFELAHGGTLFLDEIAELSPEMQSKLLQVLEDASFERVGESVSLAADVRVIAATNARPCDALACGKLRPDLFYRLSPCTIELPPLRERLEDIPPLVAALSTQVATSLGLPQVKLTPALMAPLRRYPWPGNVRELRNVLSRLVIHNSMHNQLNADIVEKTLEASRAMVALPSVPASAPPLARPDVAARTPPEARLGDQSTLAMAERRHILEMLERTGGIIAGPNGAAALLGLPRSTLQHRMNKLGIKGVQQNKKEKTI